MKHKHAGIGIGISLILLGYLFRQVEVWALVGALESADVSSFSCHVSHGGDVCHPRVALALSGIPLKESDFRA